MNTESNIRDYIGVVIVHIRPYKTYDLYVWWHVSSEDPAFQGVLGLGFWDYTRKLYNQHVLHNLKGA